MSDPTKDKSVQTSLSGYISPRTYADKYQIAEDAVRRLVSRGALKRIAGEQAHTMLVEDKDVVTQRSIPRSPDGTKRRCGRCMAWLDMSEFPQSGRSSEACRSCRQLAHRHRAGNIHHTEIDAHERSRAEEVDKLVLNDAHMAKRNARIAAHAERVALEQQQQQGDE